MFQLKAEISHAGYIKHKQHVEAPAPLSTAEVVKQEIKQLEVCYADMRTLMLTPVI